jgi:hypothetical protein
LQKNPKSIRFFQIFPRHRRFVDSIKIDACPELPPYILKRLEEVCTAGRRRTVCWGNVEGLGELGKVTGRDITTLSSAAKRLQTQASPGIYAGESKG